MRRLWKYRSDDVTLDVDRHFFAACAKKYHVDEFMSTNIDRCKYLLREFFVVHIFARGCKC